MPEPARRILIVDDNPGIRSQMKWGFDSYEVHTAENRVLAIEKLLKYRPPVVTLDLGLPPDEEGVTEGYEILSQILEKAPDTKVIVVSGSDECVNSVRAVESGAFDYYSKPIDIEDLSRIVERAFQEYAINISK